MNHEQIRRLLINVEAISTSPDTRKFWEDINTLKVREVCLLSATFKDNRDAGLTIYVGRFLQVRLYRSGDTFFLSCARLDSPSVIWCRVVFHFQGMAADIYEQAKTAFAAAATTAPP
ncbi:MAG: hypothetical protein WC702_00940 [Patescibacteria group bacterium]|jgi:hypothetical protein